MWMNILPAWMPVYAPLACQVPVETKEDTRYPETGVTDGCEPPCGLWELSSCPLEDQLVPLSIEKFPAPRIPFCDEIGVTYSLQSCKVSLCLSVLKAQRKTAERILFMFHARLLKTY